jgi:chitin synthase
MAAPQTSQASLPLLPAHQQSDTNITAHIASRFHLNQPITTLSTTGYVSVNTYNSSSKGPNGGIEGSAMGMAKEIASRTWTRLGQRQENQAVVFL